MSEQTPPRKILPIPDHYDTASVGRVFRVPYQERAAQASAWAQAHTIAPAGQDAFRTALVAIDVQNTFCLPDFELFVAGRSGNGAVEDNRRLCEFIYRNLGTITRVYATMDTHEAVQIFHPIFLIDPHGEHPSPHTTISHEDVVEGRWRFNPDIADTLGITAEQGQKHLLHYTRQLKDRQKYALTVWPYHAMLGGIGHALVPAFEEAVFFHAIARNSQPFLKIKGDNSLTEAYSAVGPEVLTGADGRQIDQKNDIFLNLVREYDAVIVAGQAKSHCVAWTLEDLLQGIQSVDSRLAEKIYLLDDCSSPVVVPGVIDYTEQAEKAYRRFSDAGMHIVSSVDSFSSRPGIGG